MFVHSHENNIESRSDIFAIFVSEDVKEIIEDALQNKGTVEIVMACHQDLGLVWIAGNLKKYFFIFSRLHKNFNEMISCGSKNN